MSKAGFVLMVPRCMLLGLLYRLSLVFLLTLLTVSSMSNGGGFVGTLACHKLGSTLFAAFAAHSGAFYTDINGPSNACAPARLPLPILEIHGGADKTVHYEGGQGDGGPQPPILSWSVT